MKKRENNFIPHFIFILFAFLLYGNTLTYDYTLDDLIVIKDNAFTVKGFSGIHDIFGYDSFTGFFGKEKKLVVGGRYRPLSIATFAAEYAFVGGFSPFLSHFINILLYAFTGILIFLILQKFLAKYKSSHWALSMPFVIAMLFLAHPVHTEVVANIKGRDEILALLLSLLSLWFMLKYTGTKQLVYFFLSNLSLFMGLLSKENAISFVFLIPLSLYFFANVDLKRNLTLGISLLSTAVIFVFIRFLVLGYISGGKLPDELLNNAFLYATDGQRYGTILYTLGLYLKLMVFPLTLTHDYYPYHIPLVELYNYRALIALGLYLAMIVYAFLKINTKNWLSYCILFFLSPLLIVSNLIFPVGTFMNERFLYMSSLGFLIAMAWLISEKLPLIIKDAESHTRLDRKSTRLNSSH